MAAATVLFAASLLSAFGHGFVEGRPVLIMLAVSTIPQVIASGVYQIVQTQRRLWLSCWRIALPRDLLLVVVTLMLLGLGAKPAAWGYLSAQLLTMLSVIGVARYVRLATTDLSGS